MPLPGSAARPYKTAVLGGGPAGLSIFVRAVRLGIFDRLVVGQRHESATGMTDAAGCGPKESIPCRTGGGASPEGKETDGSLAVASGKGACAGALWIDQAASSAFGGGSLKEYRVQSNTWAGKMASVVLSERPECTPPERVAGTCLESLRETSRAGAMLRHYGNDQGPLPIIGEFLCDAGQVIQRELDAAPDSTVLSFCKARRVERSAEGLWRIVLECVLDGPPSDVRDARRHRDRVGETVASPAAATWVVYAHQVIFATGGTQVAPQLQRKSHARKLILSDDLLRERGIDRMRTLLLKGRGPPRVAIVGGAHSAFSAAWLCLYNLLAPRVPPGQAGQAGQSSGRDELAPPLSTAQCGCLSSYDGEMAASWPGFRCPIRLVSRQDAAPPPKGTGSSGDSGGSGSSGCSSPGREASDRPSSAEAGGAAALDDSTRLPSGDHGSRSGCTCRRRRHGFYGSSPSRRGGAKERAPKASKGGAWSASRPTVAAERLLTGAGRFAWPANSISILHRSPIRVFYGSEREASLDGYEDYSSVNRTGQVHAFGGLRGDAKALYRRIRRGQETRVRLFHVKPKGSATLIRRVLEEATVIVWACGYASREIPIYDIRGRRISLKTDKAQVHVDDAGRVVRKVRYREEGAAPSTASGGGPPATAATAVSPSEPEALSGKSPADPPCASDPEALQNPMVVPGIYALGLGFGLRALDENNETEGSSGRADGVAVFMKRAATLALAGVPGVRASDVFGEGFSSWEERKAFLRTKSAAGSQPSPDDKRNLQLASVDRLCQPRGPNSPGEATEEKPLLTPVEAAAVEERQRSSVHRLSRPRNVAPVAAEKRGPIALVARSVPAASKGREGKKGRKGKRPRRSPGQGAGAMAGGGGAPAPEAPDAHEAGEEGAEGAATEGEHAGRGSLRDDDADGQAVPSSSSSGSLLDCPSGMDGPAARATAPRDASPSRQPGTGAATAAAEVPGTMTAAAEAPGTAGTTGLTVICFQRASAMLSASLPSSRCPRIAPDAPQAAARRRGRRTSVPGLRAQTLVRTASASAGGAPAADPRLRTQSAAAPGGVSRQGTARRRPRHVLAVGISAVHELQARLPRSRSLARDGSVSFPAVRPVKGGGGQRRRCSDEGTTNVRYWGKTAPPSASPEGRRWGRGRVHAA